MPDDRSYWQPSEGTSCGLSIFADIFNATKNRGTRNGWQVTSSEKDGASCGGTTSWSGHAAHPCCALQTTEPVEASLVSTSNWCSGVTCLYLVSLLIILNIYMQTIQWILSMSLVRRPSRGLSRAAGVMSSASFWSVGPIQTKSISDRRQP